MYWLKEIFFPFIDQNSSVSEKGLFRAWAVCRQSWSMSSIWFHGHTRRGTMSERGTSQGPVLCPEARAGNTVKGHALPVDWSLILGTPSASFALSFVGIDQTAPLSVRHTASKSRKFTEHALNTRKANIRREYHVSDTWIETTSITGNSSFNFIHIRFPLEWK